MIVSACSARGPRRRPGLKSGDRIVEIDGKKIETIADVSSRLAAQLAAGQACVAPSSAAGESRN